MPFPYYHCQISGRLQVLNENNKDAPDIRPDNPAFLISGIQPDTGFDFPDIRLVTGY
jgi:hypothetical protein